MWSEFFGAALKWLGGESIAASLTRVVIGMGVMRYLSKSNENAQPTNSSSTPQGIRQQISPATENKLPVVYGNAYLGGTIVDVQLTNSNKELYAVIALCEKTGDLLSSGAASDITIDDVYLSNNRITFKADGTTMDHTTDDTGVDDTNGSGLLSINLYKGNSNSPMLPCVSGTNTPITGNVPPVAYSVMPGWGASHTMENIVFAVIKMNYDPSKGLRSIPNLKFHVRNTLTKPGDVLHDYMTNVMYGAGIDAATINSTSITDLNSYSADVVTYPGHPAQPRYLINGVIRTTEPVLSNMQRISGSAGANVTYDISTGKWATVINRVTAKTLDFDDSNIIGQIGVTGTSLDGFYNSVEVQFPYAYLRDQMNFARIDLPVIQRNANEPDNQLQVTYELVNNVVQANILGNMDLRQSREDIAITFNTDYSKFNTQIGDVIGVTNSPYGWAGKLFKVIRVKKNESDSGKLTLEITAQSYNADVYTVEAISDFTPIIGVGHSIPNLGAIQTPIVPSVTTLTSTGGTITSQPSITITATIPSGVVTEMEYWYTSSSDPNDNNRPYTLLGSMRSENGGPFTIGATPSFKTVMLSSGNYYFKVRAANDSGTSAFSPPSTQVAYTYTAAPDVLPYQTPAVDNNGQMLEQNGQALNLGMLAMYAATKLNWGNILSGNVSSWSDLFGISSSAASAVNGAVTTEQAQIAAGGQAGAIAQDAINTANSASSTAASANSTAMQASNTASEALIKANQALERLPNPDDPPGPDGNVTITSTLTGQVMPSLFGTGDTAGAGTIAGIFTHDNLVFAGSKVVAELPDENVLTNPATLGSTISGKIQRFYNIPNSSSFAKPPAYNQSLTDQFQYDSKLSLYYSTATYAGGSLDQQSWSPWTLLNSNDGVTGQDANVAVVTVTYTNPAPVDVYSPYVVDEIYQGDGVGNVYLGGSLASSSYDPFKPNVAVSTTTYTQVDSRRKDLWVTVTGSKSHGGGATELIIFGTSVYGHPSGTPFAGNTAFGHVAPVYMQSYPNAISFNIVVNNGSRFVGLQQGTNKVYWSDDGESWYRVTLDGDVTDQSSWVDYISGGVLKSFDFLVYDGSKFIVYNTIGGVSHSTDGKVWTEDAGKVGVDSKTLHITATNGHYLAVGENGVQTSADGITWSAPVYNSTTFGGQAIKCSCWDGSKFIIGSSYLYGEGSALYTTTNGTSFTKLSNLNNPNLPQVLSEAQNAALSDQIALVSGISVPMPG